MKTSFYFVLWILIYPILGLFNNSFIDNNAFIVALAIVCFCSWLLNRMMPNTLTYERVSQAAPILEDVYTSNVDSFKKRLVRESNIEIALVIFGFFTYGAISRSISLIRAKAILKSNPTSEQCMEIADETYKLNYASYYDARNGVSYQDMFPPKPKYFKTFKFFSVVISAIASLLGLLYIILGVLIMLSQTTLEAGAVAGMYFLYGSLAAYFGVKDFVSCLYSKSNTMTINKEQTT